MYFTCKIWTSGICRGVSGVSEVFWKPVGAVSSQCTAVSLPAARNTQLSHMKFATNARFERSVGPLRHTHEKQSFISLDMHL